MVPLGMPLRGDVVRLGDLAGKQITMLEIACRRLDVATAQLGEALTQVRALTNQRAVSLVSARRS